MSIYRILKEGDSVTESWSGEHNGHEDPDHPAGSMTISVVPGSPNKTVYVNGILAGTKENTGHLSCGCCGSKTGKFKTYSSTVFIQGINAIRSIDSPKFADHDVPFPNEGGNVYLS